MRAASTFHALAGAHAAPSRGATFVGLVLACAAAGCTASSDEVRPPEDKLFFPTGAAVSPDQRFLFVANANSDLTYDSGAISVFDLGRVDQLVTDWLVDRAIPSGCAQDAEFSETLVCDEALLLRDQATSVRIGNFATDISVQDLDTGDGSGALRLIVPTRGDPSITWVDFDGSRLRCSTSEGFELCDDDHRLSFVFNDADETSIPEEPFAAFADTAGEFAIVTHLTTGAVTLIDSPRDGNAVITDIVTGVFAADPSTGLRGATGVAGRTPRMPEDIIYVGSRSEDRVQTFTVGRPANGAPPFLLTGNFFFLDAVGGNQGQSSDTRAMAFSSNGDRMYLVNRRPPSLQIFDTSLDANGFPRNEPIGATDICRQASTLTVAGSGDDERVYITCFQDGQIYIVDPRGLGSVDDIVTVGRGPYAISAAPGRNKLFVTNFLEDTIAVLDTTPGAATRNRVVLRIGEPRLP